MNCLPSDTAPHQDSCTTIHSHRTCAVFVTGDKSMWSTINVNVGRSHHFTSEGNKLFRGLLSDSSFVQIQLHLSLAAKQLCTYIYMNDSHL